MYCPEKLKLNKHQVISIPKGREVFGRVGSAIVPQNLYTGDNVAPDHQTKVDQLASTERDMLEEYDRKMNEEGK